MRCHKLNCALSSSYLHASSGSQILKSIKHLTGTSALGQALSLVRTLAALAQTIIASIAHCQLRRSSCSEASVGDNKAAHSWQLRRPVLAAARTAQAAMLAAMLAAAPPCSISVRIYKPEDALEVRRIFSEGMSSLWRAFFLATVLEPSFLAVLTAATALAAWVASGEGAPAAAKGGLLAALFLVLVIAGYTAHAVQDYIRQSLSSDLQDIQAFYINNPAAPGSCFWVAEATQLHDQTQDGDASAAKQQRTIVGCVALEYKTAEQAELRRMSVDARWQRRGIAAQLARALLAHAKAAGFAEVFLTTSSGQPAARALYERMGWREVQSGKAFGPVNYHKYSYFFDPALHAAASAQTAASKKET